MNTEETSESINADLLKAVMGEIFRGRSFHLEQAVLTPQQAFDTKGFLPLFAARAHKRFATLHGEGIKVSRCISCGLDRPIENVCDQTCPLKRGERVLRFPFTFELMAPPEALLGATVRMAPHRNSLYLALFFIQDVAMEMLQMAQSPRMISVAPLLQDLVSELEPIVSQIQPAQAAPVPSGVEPLGEPEPATTPPVNETSIREAVAQTGPDSSIPHTDGEPAPELDFSELGLPNFDEVDPLQALDLLEQTPNR